MLRIRRSKPAALCAGAYLLLTCVAAWPLIGEGYIGHGNGLSYLLSLVLTSPLSLLLFLLTDALFEFNAFHMTGWPYFLMLCELAAGAAFNAALIYLAATFVQRVWE